MTKQLVVDIYATNMNQTHFQISVASLDNVNDSLLLLYNALDYYYYFTKLCITPNRLQLIVIFLYYCVITIIIFN